MNSEKTNELQNTMKAFAKSLTTTFAAALILSLAPTAAWSQNGAKGGAADLVGSKPVQTTATTVSHDKQCAMAKPCPDCRTVTKSMTVTEGKQNLTKTLPVAEHLCPNCKTSIQTTGHGKAKNTVVTHVCQKSVGKAASCCAN